MPLVHDPTVDRQPVSVLACTKQHGVKGGVSDVCISLILIPIPEVRRLGPVDGPIALEWACRKPCLQLTMFGHVRDRSQAD